MLKFIFYCIVAYVVLRVLRWILTPLPRSRSNARRASAAKMVRCESCGMYVTQSSALSIGEMEFCSKTCARQKARRA